MVTMNLNLPIRTVSRRNDESRNNYGGGYTPTSSTEAIAGPIREPAPLNDRLIVGLDFGTTYSGYVYFMIDTAETAVVWLRRNSCCPPSIDETPPTLG
jgi:hypothetical protein